MIRSTVQTPGKPFIRETRRKLPFSFGHFLKAESIPAKGLSKRALSGGGC